jgi:hypothetical protein
MRRAWIFGALSVVAMALMVAVGSPWARSDSDDDDHGRIDLDAHDNLGRRYVITQYHDMPDGSTRAVTELGYHDRSDPGSPFVVDVSAQAVGKDKAPAIGASISASMLLASGLAKDDTDLQAIPLLLSAPDLTVKVRRLPVAVLDADKTARLDAFLEGGLTTLSKDDVLDSYKVLLPLLPAIQKVRPPGGGASTAGGGFPAQTGSPN